MGEEARQMFQGMFAWVRQHCTPPCSEDEINKDEEFRMKLVARLPEQPQQASAAEQSTSAASCDTEALGKCATDYSEAYSALSAEKLSDPKAICPLLTTYSTC